MHKRWKVPGSYIGMGQPHGRAGTRGLLSKVRKSADPATTQHTTRIPMPPLSHTLSASYPSLCLE